MGFTRHANKLHTNPIYPDVQFKSRLSMRQNLDMAHPKPQTCN
jgi:hypothetical protein